MQLNTIKMEGRVRHGLTNMEPKSVATPNPLFNSAVALKTGKPSLLFFARMYMRLDRVSFKRNTLSATLSSTTQSCATTSASEAEETDQEEDTPGRLAVSDDDASAAAAAAADWRLACSDRRRGP